NRNCGPAEGKSKTSVRRWIVCVRNAAGCERAQRTRPIKRPRSSILVTDKLLRKGVHQPAFESAISLAEIAGVLLQQDWIRKVPEEIARYLVGESCAIAFGIS